jgi:hypothetical protein
MTETQAMSDLKETMDLLKALPGGEAVAAFLGGGYWIRGRRNNQPALGSQGSELVISLPWKKCHVTFVLDQWVDVHLLGFSWQNVIGGLRVKKSLGRDPGFAELGVGYVQSAIEIELLPCFGAHGTVSGRVKAIKIEASA